MAGCLRTLSPAAAGGGLGVVSSPSQAVTSKRRRESGFAGGRGGGVGGAAGRRWVGACGGREAGSGVSVEGRVKRLPRAPTRPPSAR